MLSELENQIEKNSSKKVLPSLRDVIINKQNWTTLRLVDIKEIYKSLTGSSSGSIKKDPLIDLSIERGLELLDSSSPTDLDRAFSTHILNRDFCPTFILKHLSFILVHKTGESTEDRLDSTIYTSLRNKLLINDLSSRKHSVLEYRGGVDIYSKLPLADLTNPHVDHIVERQLVAYTLMTAGLGIQISSSEAIVRPIKAAVNHNKNLNVTSGDLNVTKGSAVTQWIREDRASNRPRDLHVMLFNNSKGRERKIAQYTGNVVAALDSCFDLLEEDIRGLRRLDGHVTGGQFEQVTRRLSELHDKTGMSRFDQAERVTRSKVKKDT
ncbi:hypothetical protein EON65_08550 [archaeon]|nr:MAG: hypothetical protein EON65_08550 [archaeon]